MTRLPWMRSTRRTRTTCYCTGRPPGDFAATCSGTGRTRRSGAVSRRKRLKCAPPAVAAAVSAVLPMRYKSQLIQNILLLLRLLQHNHQCRLCESMSSGQICGRIFLRDELSQRSLVWGIPCATTERSNFWLLSSAIHENSEAHSRMLQVSFVAPITQRESAAVWGEWSVAEFATRQTMHPSKFH
jgi:hypothetical protein